MCQPTEPIKFKICSKCKVEKPTSEFHRNKASKDGCVTRCKDCQRVYGGEYYKKNKDAPTERERSKAYREANKRAVAAYQKAYAEANKDAKRAYDKAYAEANKDARLVRQKAYDRANREAKTSYTGARRKTDPLFALRERIRRLVLLSIANRGYSKKARTYEILGCSCEQFRAHIEGQFTDGMSWDNRREWHLDHIYPVSKAIDEAHLIALNHYTNFQPLWASDNIRKRDKIPEHLSAPAETN